MASSFSAKLTWTTADKQRNHPYVAEIFDGDQQVVSRTDARGKLTITNNGPDPLTAGSTPSVAGKIPSVRLLSDDRPPLVLAQGLDVPPIPSSSSREVEFDVAFPEAGAFVVAYRLLPAAEVQFEMLSPKSTPVFEWREPCIVVDREKALMLELLTRILERQPGPRPGPEQIEKALRDEMESDERQENRTNGKRRK